MRNLVELLLDRSRNRRVRMPVQIRPDRRVRIQILAPLGIAQHRALARFNNDRLLGEPILHLRERMPEVAMVFIRERVHQTPPEKTRCPLPHAPRTPSPATAPSPS